MFKKNIRHHYPDIERGCSFCVPIAVKDEEDKGINLTEYEANFTLKRTPYDFDRYDEKALISKTISLENAVAGEFNILLSSEELDLPPGPYYFDLILIHKINKLSVRLLCCDFNLVGGPGNRQVSPEVGTNPMSFMGININLISGPPFIIYAPHFATAEGKLAELISRVEVLEKLVKNVPTFSEMTVEEWLAATTKMDLADISNDVYDGTITHDMNIKDGRTS